MSVTLTVRCILCKSTRELGPGEMPAGEMPMCSKCLMPMIAESAVAEGSTADAPPTIVCRARFEDTECYHGSLTRRQFGVGNDAPLSADGTFDGESIVCDACYVRLQPFTPSGMALNRELATAIDHYREQLAHVRGHANPQQLADEAKAACERFGAGTRGHVSASALRSMARREVERRAEAGGSAR